jgi:excisionase family DNA binding protein
VPNLLWREASRCYDTERVDRPETKDEILTLKELAAYLKINPRTVYRLLADRKLPGFRVGHGWRFRKSDVDEWTRSGGGLDGGEADHG